MNLETLWVGQMVRKALGGKAEGQALTSEGRGL